MKKQKVVIVIFLIFIAAAVSAQENNSAHLDIGIFPGGGIPLGVEDNEFFSYGGAGDIVIKYRFGKIPLLYAGGRLGYDYLPVEMDTAVSVISGGPEVGILWQPAFRFALSAGVSSGYFYSLLNDRSGPGGGNPYIKPSLGAELFFSESFGISLEGSYRNYLGLYQGAAVTLGAIIRIDTMGDTGPLISEPVPLSQAKSAERLGLLDVGFISLFPVFYSYYDDHLIGSGKMINYSDKAIENISMNLFIKQYMDNPKPCIAPGKLGSGEEGELEIYALLTDNILGITEGTKVSAELTLSYSFGGRDYQETYIETVRVHDRNATTWDDDRKVAAFVTAKEPAVLALAKSAAGIARQSGNGMISRNFRTAIAVNEALRLYGMKYVIDPKSVVESDDGTALDFLQFPRQTLQYKAGDCDDLSILNCALFESVGIETAFITVPGHIFIAFRLGMTPGEVKKVFSSSGDFIVIEDIVWVPYEITDIEGSFISAWQMGIKEWREAEVQGAACLYPTHEAWQLYEPVGLPGTEMQYGFPDTDSIRQAYMKEFRTLVDREIFPMVKMVEERIAEKGETAGLLNRLGSLYARYGLPDKAEEKFSRILTIDPGYLPALVNLGNISFLNGDYPEALNYYEKAAEINPSRPAVLLGLARTHNELENYGIVNINYSKLKAIKPELAEQFAYLDMERSESVRAVDAEESRSFIVWDDETIDEK